MKKIIVTILSVLFVLSISGCHSQLPYYTIKSMEDGCKNRGGLYEIDTKLLITGVCQDGSLVSSKGEIVK